jgi:hypothetical protein
MTKMKSCHTGIRRPKDVTNESMHPFYIDRYLEQGRISDSLSVDPSNDLHLEMHIRIAKLNMQGFH